MKKVLLLFLFLILIVAGKTSANAYELKKVDLIDFEIVNSKEYHFENQNIIVLGNYHDLSKDTIDNLLKSGKTLFIYDYYLLDNIYDNLFSLNSAVLYTNNNNKKVDIVNIDTDNFSEFKEEVIKFYTEKTNSIQNLSLQVNSVDTNLFQPLYEGSFREIKKPYGYIDVVFTVKKYRASSVSSLYLMESKASFTPGKMAKDNGESGFDDWYNKFGYFHLEAMQAVNEIDQSTIRKGGIPYLKDAYPENVPGTITISSTYSIGATLGYSFTNGFSLDNITMEQNTNYGLNISYSYSKAYTTSEPSLSTQKSPSNTNEYQWTYNYDTQRNETNHLNTGYLFEMNNYNHDLFEGDVSFKFQYKMTVHDNGWWIFGDTESFEGFKYIGYY